MDALEAGGQYMDAVASFKNRYNLP
jgi:hypothetical protein